MDDTHDIAQRIRARIEELKQAREKHIAEASRTLGGYDGAIGELEALLAPVPAPQPEPDGE